MLKHTIDISTIWNLSGWAYHADQPNTEVTIEVSYKGNKIAEQKATLFRKKIKEQQLHPTGKVGFSINLGDKVQASAGDTITITMDGNTIKEVPLVRPKGNLSSTADSALIVGQGKSGTSKLTYVVASGMTAKPTIHFEPNGNKGLPNIRLHKELTEKKPVVTKSLYGANQSVRFGALSKLYDRKIWILRDPRDRIISLMLYRWFKGHNPDPKKFERALSLVKQKENNPQSVNIQEIWNLVYSPGMYAQRLQEEYVKLDNVLSNLDSSWYILRYEDMVDDNLDGLNQYLGFKTTLDEEVPDNLNRVVRSKGYGNWKNWFTPDDVTFYQAILNPFMSKYFDNLNEWDISQSPSIDPSKGSEYMTKLFYGKK